MARYLSPHRNYSIQVFEAEEQMVLDARGFAQTVTLVKPVIANFEATGLIDHEIDDALTRFNVSGLPEGISPLTRISVFDTEAFVEHMPEKGKGNSPGRNEFHAQLVERLDELQKRNVSEFFKSEPPRKPIPWPSYENDTVEEILAFQERLGVQPQIIRLYELENQNRKEIVKAMLQIEDPEGQKEEAEAVATVEA